MFKNHTIYNEKEADDLFKKCITLPIEFREYMRFGKMVNVPRGQIAVSSKSEYKYTQAGGTPTILKFEDYPFLQDVLDDVNKKFDIPFNTMLINHYRDGNDYISNHSDSVVGWNKKYGFSTLALGDGERTFRIKKIDTKENIDIYHKKGDCIYIDYDQNQLYTHGIPKRKTIKKPRISITLRVIE